MNKDSKDNSIDRLETQLNAALQSWGDAHSADRNSIEAAKASLLESLASGSAVQLNYPRPQPIWWKPAGFFAATIAFAVVCGALLWPSNPPNDLTAIQIEAAAVEKAKSDSRRHQVVLTRFRELFGGQLRSISEVDDQIDLSLAEESRVTEDGSDFLAIDLVLLSRSASSARTDWQVEHRASVLARSEHRVDVKVGDDPIAFSVWAFPVDDDMISVDLQLMSFGKTQIALQTSELQHYGTANAIHSFTQSGTEYRVYQTCNRMLENPTPENAFLKLGLRSIATNFRK